MMQQTVNDLNVPFANNGHTIDATGSSGDDDSALSHNNGNQSSRSMWCVLSIINRMLILYTGLQLALGFFVADGMASDDGTTFAITFSYIGLIGCLFWVIGAIAGSIYNQWYFLLPGLIVHLFLYVPIIIYWLLFEEKDEAHEWFGDVNSTADNLIVIQSAGDDAWARGADNVQYLRGMQR